MYYGDPPEVLDAYAICSYKQQRRFDRNCAIFLVACIVALIATIAAARADDLPACKQLRDAVTRYDVNVTIQRERVEFWNKVVRASRALRRAAGCPVN